MSKNQAFLEDIELAFSDFTCGRCNIGALEKRIAKNLSECTFNSRKNTYIVSIIRNGKASEPFFGARIYPTIDYMEKIVSETVTEAHPFKDINAAWDKIDQWVIELDSAMLDRDALSLTPKELVACLLHEIGHTVYSDKVIERFYRCYRSMRVHLNCADKDAIKLGYALFMVPLSVSCGIRSWTRGRNGIKEEFFADQITRTEGYGDFYVSMLSKIIEAYGSAILDETETACDNRVTERMRWAAINITDATRRRNKLSTDIYMDSAKTPSAYLKSLGAKVLSSVGIGMKEKYTGDAVESTTVLEMMLSDKPIDFNNPKTGYSVTYDTDRYRTFDAAVESRLANPKYHPGTAAFESILKRKVRKGLPSWMDIDHIQIEVDRITNHHDRMFVLEMIYSKIDDINESMDYFSGDKRMFERHKPEADAMLERLEELREAVLRKSSFATKYEVFVKSPAGYEG